MRHYTSDGYARTCTRLDGVPNPARRVLRVVLCVGALALASLAVAWAAPRVSAKVEKELLPMWMKQRGIDPQILQQIP